MNKFLIGNQWILIFLFASCREDEIILPPPNMGGELIVNEKSYAIKYGALIVNECCTTTGLALSNKPVTLDEGSLFAKDKTISLIINFHLHEETLVPANYQISSPSDSESNYTFDFIHLDFPLGDGPLPDGGEIAIAKLDDTYSLIFDVTREGKGMIKGTVYGNLTP